MNMLQKLRGIYHLAVLIIFMNQAHQSLHKYFQYPIVTQTAKISIEDVEKPTVDVCFGDPFDYEIAADHGYNRLSEFLVGKLGNSTSPTWNGVHGNLSFEQMQDLLYEKDFSKVELREHHDLTYRLGRGFCLYVHGFDKSIKITTKEKDIKAFVVHDSTDNHISANKVEETLIQIGLKSGKYDYKIYELGYEILDSTIFDGISCVDYRNQPESYGECNEKALRKHILTYYGCYPPWIKTTERKTCEVDIPSINVGIDKISHICEDFDALTESIMIDIMAQCPEPCYQVNVIGVKRFKELVSWQNKAELKILDDTKTVTIYKSVYSYDFLTLTVELGSALGLWLGKDKFKFFYFTLGSLFGIVCRGKKYISLKQVKGKLTLKTYIY